MPSESPISLLLSSSHWGAAKSAVSCNFFFFFKDKRVIVDQNRNIYNDSLVSIYRTDFPYYDALAFYIPKSHIISEEHVQ